MKLEKRNYSDKEQKKILNEFVNKLADNQKNIPEDIAEIVNKNFWNLLY